MDLLSRLAVERVQTALTDTPVVIVQGPRQAGKSTLVRDLLDDPGDYVTLDDLAVLSAARSDPQGFVAGLPARRVCIDEVQRAPDLVLAIKAAVDRDRRPGRFLLTGSADVLTTSRARESLAGRSEVVPLWPLAQCELDGTPGLDPSRLFAHDLDLSRASPVDSTEVWQRVRRGGYPEAVRRSDERRAAWWDAYVQEVVRFEIAELRAIEGVLEVPTLLRLLADRTADLVNYAHLARDLGVSPRTSTRYLTLLDDTYLVQTVAAWARSERKRLVKSPKAVVADSGLAWHLAGLGEAPAGLHAGRHLEGFVLSELRRLLDVRTGSPLLFHFRTSGQREVDAVLESRDGRLVGIEVKSARTVRAKDFAGLQTFADTIGDRMAAGLLLHPGEHTVPFGNNLWAVPLSLLWTDV